MLEQTTMRLGIAPARLRRPAALLGALLGAVLSGLMGATGVAAHARLVGSTPEPDARLPGAPAEVAVWFDSAVEASGSGLSLLDRTGRVLAEARGTAPGTRDRLTLAPPSLAPGTYTVVWQNVSAADGHADSGYYAFSAGSASPPLVLTLSPERQRVGNAVVTLASAAQSDGGQRFEATVLDARGAPLEAVQRVQLRWRPQQPAVSPAVVALAPLGGGRYAGTSLLPSLAGRYDAEVQVRVLLADDLTARFTLQADLPAQATPTATAPAATATTLPTATPEPAVAPAATPEASGVAVPAAPTETDAAPPSADGP